MIRKFNLTISLAFMIGLIYNSSGQTIEYEAKCKENGKIFKYRCAHLILKSDSTYYYEEIAVDIPIAFESGQYRFNGDTLILTTKNYGTLRYIKEKKSLMIYDPDNILNITRTLTGVRKKNKAKT